jgi:phytoene dehydrogenase-like protein
MQLASTHNKSSGYPIGGSLPIVQSIEKRYANLGGKINFKDRINRIIVENNRAAGLRLANGSEVKSDYVISAADGYETIFEMLEGKFVDEKIQEYYSQFPVFTPLVYVGMGVNRSFEYTHKIISGIKFELQKSIRIGDSENKFLMVRVHNYEPTMAPKGKTLLTCSIESSYPYWNTLREDIKKYNSEKERIGKEVIEALDNRFPGLANQIEMIDVATPVTYFRYTGNWQGTFEGWVPTPNVPPTFIMKKTLQGLDDFYMVGQWVMPGGGLPSGVLSGRLVTQMLCKKDGKKFLTSKP